MQKVILVHGIFFFNFKYLNFCKCRIHKQLCSVFKQHKIICTAKENIIGCFIQPRRRYWQLCYWQKGVIHSYRWVERKQEKIALYTHQARAPQGYEMTKSENILNCLWCHKSCKTLIWITMEVLFAMPEPVFLSMWKVCTKLCTVLLSIVYAMV